MHLFKRMQQKRSHISGFFQQTFFYSKTQQQKEVNPRPELTKQISEIKDFPKR